MYQDFFGFNEVPFSIAPNPKYLLISERHGEALQHLIYQLCHGNGGFVLLTGEVGTGKTTISRYLLGQLPKETKIGILQHPCIAQADLYQAVCDAFSIPVTSNDNTHHLFKKIEHFLSQNHDQGCKNILLIDEAQHLSPQVLEQLRLLTNLETDERKWLQVILIGQPELNDLLRLSQLRQLAQRITARYHLMPLTLDEVDTYLRYRMQVAGCLQPVFTRKATKALYKISGGIPRMINLIADQSLILAYQANTRQVSPQLIKQGSRGLILNSENTVSHDHKNNHIPTWIITPIVTGLLASVIGWFSWMQFGPMPAPLIEKQIQQVPAPADDYHQALFLEHSSKYGSYKHALQNLYKLWGYQIAQTEHVASKYASRAGLRFWETSVTLETLKKMNHPAVIALQNESGRSFFATLAKIEDSKATLLLGESAWEIDIQWLKTHWMKRVSLFWKLPPHGQGLIGPRSQAAAIQWLEDKTSLLLQESARNIKTYDAVLSDKVKRLQASFHLHEDGLAGTQTLIHLNAQSDMVMPRLWG